MKRTMNTPCPVALSQITNVDDTFTDCTTNIEYTTAFDASFKNVKPKRGNTTRRNTTSFAIHEDIEVKSAKQQTTLAQPARRVVPAIKSSKIQIPDEAAVMGKRALLRTTRHAKRGGIPIVNKKEHTSAVVTPESASQRDGGCIDRQSEVKSRTKRRDTLYIPSENTTQPTIWMGIFSPLKQEVSEDNGYDIAAHEELTGIAARMIRKKGDRATAMEPKTHRKPLHPSKAISEQVNVISDQAGEPTGKENCPPIRTVPKQKTGPKSKQSSKTADMKLLADNIDTQRKSFLRQARLNQLSQPKRVSQHAVPDISTMYEIGTLAFNAQKPTSRRQSRHACPQLVVQPDGLLGGASTKSTVPILPKAFSNTNVAPNSIHSVRAHVDDLPIAPMCVPILEHIESPSMYEESWLEHQEIVITQLLNALFKQTETEEGEDVELSVLRTELVDKYNSLELRLIYNRVQAAALYGSLSLSQEAMFNLHNLAHDIGRRQAFIKFWLNYDIELLQVALETVSGKRILDQHQKYSLNTKSTSVDKTKSIARFIEEYLLRHEDGQFKPAGTGSVDDLGSKTIVKSIMLIKVLDMIKDVAEQPSSKCLFRKASLIKSSTVAIQSMMRMLNTSIGDPIRALRHLGYEVYHEQKPMDDVIYGIDNLAVDMRNGVNLARLVEILLYRPKAKESSTVHGGCQTITMNDGESVDIDSSHSFPLTKHLKMPCSSRATKIWNVQLSLEALRHVHPMKPFIEDINAASIVDGHREKTIQLLWTIVGQFGRAHFIDSVDLTQEIRRLSPDITKRIDTQDEDTSFDSNQERLEYLVKTWARAVAASRGLTVRNFSTSFADGQVFKSILDEYEPYLCQGEGSTHLTLNLRLSNLGCSRQFADLFDNRSGQMHILGKDSVLAALVFLCSRVVGPTKVWRNTVKIQRCWRKHWSQVVQKRRAVKKELADACAEIVQLRQRSNELIGTETNVDQLAGMIAKSGIESDIWLSV